MKLFITIAALTLITSCASKKPTETVAATPVKTETPATMKAAQEVKAVDNKKSAKKRKQLKQALWALLK